MNFYLKKIIRICGFLIALHNAVAYAQQAPIDNGLSYLRTTQNADGSWGGTETSLNTVLQTTATTARTLQLLGTTDTSLTNSISFLTAQTPNTVDDLSQQVEALAASGVDVSTLAASIKTAQQADGGWGLDLEKNFTSAVVDTGSALRALKVAGATDVTIDSTALAYLLTTQNSDDGFGFYRGDVSNVYMTSLVSSTLQRFTQTISIASSLNKATAYLIAHQNPDGGFGSGGASPAPTETALAYIALVSVTTDNTVLGNAINYLTATQLQNGSWHDDMSSIFFPFLIEKHKKNGIFVLVSLLGSL